MAIRAAIAPSTRAKPLNLNHPSSIRPRAGLINGAARFLGRAMLALTPFLTSALPISCGEAKPADETCQDELASFGPLGAAYELDSDGNLPRGSMVEFSKVVRLPECMGNENYEMILETTVTDLSGRETDHPMRYHSETNSFSVSLPAATWGRPFYVRIYKNGELIDTEEAWLELPYISSPSGLITVSGPQIPETNPDGPIARRPVMFEAVWNDPEETMGSVSYDWEIIRTATGEVVHRASGRVIEFTAEEAGGYRADVTLNGGELAEPMRVSGQPFLIYDFAEPNVSVLGQTSFNGGDTAVFEASLSMPPNTRHRGPEDDDATCSWKLSHEDPETLETVYDTEESGSHWTEYRPCSEVFEFTLPQVWDRTSYTLEVRVRAGDNAYEVQDVTHSFDVWQSDAVSNLSLDGRSQYTPNRPYPFYPVTVTASLGTLPEGLSEAEATYEYVFSDANFVPIPGLSISSPDNQIQVTFTEEQRQAYNGLFNVTVSAYTGETLIGEWTANPPIDIYEFPLPGASISMSTRSVNVGDIVIFTANIPRNWTEDEAAEVHWELYHLGTNGERVLDHSTDSRQFLRTLDQELDYTITLTVMGKNQEQVVYTEEVTPISFRVWDPYSGQHTVTLSDNLPQDVAYLGDVAENVTIGCTCSDDPDVTPRITIISPDGQGGFAPATVEGVWTVPDISFDRIGDYGIKVDMLGDGNVIASTARTITVREPYTGQHTVILSSNLPQNNAFVGDVVQNIYITSTDSRATPVITIISPDGQGGFTPLELAGVWTIDEIRFDYPGEYSITVNMVRDGNIVASTARTITARESYTGQHTVILSGNLPLDNVDVGEVVQNIQISCSDTEAAPMITIVSPDGQGGFIQEDLDVWTIPEIRFDEPGEYSITVNMVRDGNIVASTARTITAREPFTGQHTVILSGNLPLDNVDVGEVVHNIQITSSDTEAVPMITIISPDGQGGFIQDDLEGWTIDEIRFDYPGEYSITVNMMRDGKIVASTARTITAREPFTGQHTVILSGNLPLDTVDVGEVVQNIQLTCSDTEAVPMITIVSPDGQGGFIQEDLEGVWTIDEIRFDYPGEYSITVNMMRGEDIVASTARTITARELYTPGCYTIDDPGAVVRNPQDATMRKGADTLFSWTVNDLLDCEDQDLTRVSHNAEDILHDPVVDYGAGTLTVSGRILPAISGGTIKVNFEDENGLTKTVSLYPPIIEPAQITLTSLFIQAGEAANFVAPEVSGAQEYRLWVTRQGSSTRYGEQVLPSNTYQYSYTPAQAVEHTLHLEITTYNDEIITATYPFTPAEASAPSEDICYTGPFYGAINRTPQTSSIVRGDNTMYTWTVNDIRDCLGENATYVDSNISDILYSASAPQYSGQNLTFSGRIRSNISGGSILTARFKDRWGHLLNIPIYDLPSISEPELPIIDPWIKVSEDVDLSLLLDPAGTSFYYTITRPYDPAYTSGWLTGSSYLSLPSTEKTQIGIYQINLAMSFADGRTQYLTESFPVHED